MGWPSVAGTWWALLTHFSSEELEGQTVLWVAQCLLCFTDGSGLSCVSMCGEPCDGVTEDRSQVLTLN